MKGMARLSASSFASALLKMQIREGKKKKKNRGRSELFQIKKTYIKKERNNRKKK